jgi:hypothetical protein
MESNEADATAIVKRECGVDPIPGGTYYLKVEEVYGREVDDYTYAWDAYEDCSLRPDLVPIAPTGFQYPVVPNSIKNTKQASSTLYAGKPTYFDWFFTNIGGSRPPDGYYSRVWVGNYLAIEQRENGINPGWLGGREDWEFTVPQPGVYTVRFEVDATKVVSESNENNNVWERQFEWKPVNGWWAEFYNNQNLSGDPVLVRDDPEINFEWNAGSPGPGVNADNFSVRWTRNVNFNNGVYRFNLSRDDGMRFYIDGQLKLDKWVYGVEDHIVVQNMTSGPHALKLEAMDIDGHARAKLSWDRCYNLTTSASPGAGGDVNRSPQPNCGDQSYVDGTRVTLTAVTTGNYTFNNWSGAISGSTNPQTLTMNGNKTVTANFSLPCYSLTRSHTGQGSDPTASPANSTGCSSGQYAAGQQINLTAAPAAGWRVTGWSGTNNNSSTSTSNTVTMPSANRTVSVTYEQLPPNCYNLTTDINPLDSGTISALPSPNCAGGTYTAGTQVTLTAIAVGNFLFNNWSGALSGISNPQTLTIDSNKTVAANFRMPSQIFRAFLPQTIFQEPASPPCFAGPDEQEPNNSRFDQSLGTPNGPLCFGKMYVGRRNDQHDYFYFDLDRSGEVIVDLNTKQNGGGVQLILFYGRDREPIDEDQSLKDDLQVRQTNTRPGRYYIQVFSEKYNPTAGEPYTLMVTFTPDR